MTIALASLVVTALVLTRVGLPPVSATKGGVGLRVTNRTQLIASQADVRTEVIAWKVSGVTHVSALRGMWARIVRRSPLHALWKAQPALTAVVMLTAVPLHILCVTRRTSIGRDVVPLAPQVKEIPSTTSSGRAKCWEHVTVPLHPHPQQYLNLPPPRAPKSSRRTRAASPTRYAVVVIPSATVRTSGGQGAGSLAIVSGLTLLMVLSGNVAR